MKSCNLAEVGVRLEEAVKRVSDDTYTPLLLYQAYEMTAIAILDSEHENWPEGVLCRYLMAYLSEKRRELGLLPSQLE